MQRFTVTVDLVFDGKEYNWISEPDIAEEVRDSLMLNSFFDEVYVVGVKKEKLVNINKEK
jgi:hypothetical protein